MRIGYFISPHGFGHAARAAAVMAAVQKREPSAHFDIFTLVPEWFFEDSLWGPFGYHAVLSDVGLVQHNSFAVDLPATVAQLEELVPFREPLISKLAEKVRECGCALLVCDIAPLGIAVARAAAVPSLLIENFTWDWIYSGYVEQEPGLERFIAYLAETFAAADYHIQTEPVSCPDGRWPTTAPISRTPRQTRAEVRAALGIDPDAPTALVTMGGSPGISHALDRDRLPPDAVVLIPGPVESVQRDGNVLWLAQRSGIYHPDLIAAADVVIAKLGYSTVAEVYASGAPLGYVPRQWFAESVPLARFVQERMSGIEIPEEDIYSGTWVDVLPRLFSLSRSSPGPNGSDQIAEFIFDLVKEDSR